jgi:hypothetical protein
MALPGAIFFKSDYTDKTFRLILTTCRKLFT